MNQRKSIFLLLTLIAFLFGCKKNEIISESDKSKYIYPSEFIVPKNNIDTNLNFSKETEDILENLTNFEVIDQFNDCADEKGNICKGSISVPTKIFIEYTNEKKELSILQKHEADCDCTEANSLVSYFETIPIDKIASIDTISGVKDINGVILTSIIINPKFNMEVVKFKRIEKFYDKDFKKYEYSKINGKTKDPIIFYSKKNNIIYLKNEIEKLINQSKK